jgi:hypothetical protein
MTAVGIAGERVMAVRAGRLTAVVGQVRRIPRPTPDRLRSYDAVVRALSRTAPAVLPARYGTQVREVEELSAILMSRQASLRRQLARVRNRVQMTVRVVDADAPRGEPEEAPRASGTAYLRGRAAARRVPAFDPLRVAVRRWVRDERVERRGPVATVYQLIPRGSVGAYRRALDRAAAAAGARIVVSGPWPPYAFADPLG